MKVVQVVASVAAEASGPSYSVRRLSDSLTEQGVESQLWSTITRGQLDLNVARSRVFPCDFGQVPVVKRLCFSRKLHEALDQSASSGAILHSHGLWLMPNVYPGWSAARHGWPLIVSPRGMLGEAALAFSYYKKRAFWAIAQKRALYPAACFHATSLQECLEIRAFGLTAPVAIIPNGIDLPLLVERPKMVEGTRTVLCLSRIHPKKGIDRLIEAWAQIEGAHGDWQLRIVGPSEKGTREGLERRCRALGLARVVFEDAAFGEAKQEAYQDADLFVLPTLNENFGMVVAEALANATPVICTVGAPWKGLAEHRCGWWIDHGVEPLSAALKTAMAMPRRSLDVMGSRGRAWMERDFSWGKIASNMAHVYRWCVKCDEQPDFVLTNT
ncbi:glycosyltransferase [Mesorhizobium sp.]|uniref:glycosyltransferase n=1 Tax=Mesorhizobium sp. TaxID=1871066 RepID=UPI0025D4AD89|nr:glycosyltransferase [Mesorhizobium sp.]